ncbi:MAG TPA: hypothetical protein VF339_03480 [Gammaproteobacteria bacterium]
MAKPKNLLQTVTIKVSGNALLEHYLEKLVETGFYGNNPTEAAGIVLSREIERLVKEGVIPKAPEGVLRVSRKTD